MRRRGFDGRSEVSTPVRAGTVVGVVTGAAGTVTAVPITFNPPFPPGTTVALFADVVTSRPDVNTCAPGTANETGGTAYLSRNAASAALDVNWQAIAKTQ